MNMHVGGGGGGGGGGFDTECSVFSSANTKMAISATPNLPKTNIKYHHL